MRLASWAPLATATMLLGACGATPPTAPDAVLLDPTTLPTGGGSGGSTGGSGGGGAGDQDTTTTGGGKGPVTALGAFRGVGHTGRGSVSFTMANGIGRLDFSSDFAVSGVPGPFVYLNTTNNANTGSPLRISALRSNTGAQSYTFQLIPGVNYRYVLIWCDPFNTAVAEAVIATGP